jgi:hypothetical protein
LTRQVEGASQLPFRMVEFHLPQQMRRVTMMPENNKSLSWLPGFLVVAGVFLMAAGLLSDGPDRVGGIVFGVVALAAAGAIVHRRTREARAASHTGANTPPPPFPNPSASSAPGAPSNGTPSTE